jgi:RNA polymerase-binding protein DksA
MPCLILVKRGGASETKLQSDHLRKNETVTDKRHAEFGVLLRAQRELLLGEVRARIAASGEGLGLANQSKITDDDGLADAAAEMDVAMLIRESQELQEIEAALARLADGSYGSCYDCGAEIGTARLKAYPAARRCLPCQEKYERAQGRSQ